MNAKRTHKPASPAGDSTTLSIAAASEASGIGEHTLRYYDRIGLLPELRRAGGRRRFSEADLAALSLVACLRDTGMPLKRIHEFMAASGPRTPDTRLEILRKHREDLVARLDEYRRAEHRVDFKIWYYEEAKRRGGIDKLPAMPELLAQYRSETGKSIKW